MLKEMKEAETKKPEAFEQTNKHIGPWKENEVI